MERNEILYCSQCNSPIKPEITFFGEQLPQRFLEYSKIVCFLLCFIYFIQDFKSCDLLIVMGTSLSVQPFSSLASDYVKLDVPRILINLEPIELPYDLKWFVHIPTTADTATLQIMHDLAIYPFVL